MLKNFAVPSYALFLSLGNIWDERQRNIMAANAIPHTKTKA
jgi:hypothetical protein